MTSVRDVSDHERDPPFARWEMAIKYDRALDFDSSRNEFQIAAESFFYLASRTVDASRALLEYSTLMDSFAEIQNARKLSNEGLLEQSLTSFTKACEILRATVHFGFLAPYVAACQSVELARKEDDDPSGLDDSFQGFKNAISLFEQSKIALSFRDENHPLIRTMDAYIKYSMSNALALESKILGQQFGAGEMANQKLEQARKLMEESKTLASLAGIEEGLESKVDYFPLDDFKRALTGPFLLSFPEGDYLLIVNVGATEARINSIGQTNLDFKVAPNGSVRFPAVKLGKGKIRLVYSGSGKNYNEGSLTMI